MGAGLVRRGFLKTRLKEMILGIEEVDGGKTQ